MGGRSLAPDAIGRRTLWAGVMTAGVVGSGCIETGLVPLFPLPSDGLTCVPGHVGETTW